LQSSQAQGKGAGTTALETSEMFCSNAELKIDARKEKGQK